MKSKPARGLILLDIGAWSVGLGLASVSLALYRPAAPLAPVAIEALALASAHVVLGWVVGLYGVRHRIGTTGDILLLVATLLATTLLGAVALVVGPVALESRGRLGSTLASGAPLVLVASSGARLLFRRHRDRRRAGASRPHRVLVFGAGEVGAAVVRRMITDKRGTYEPVGIVDDDAALWRLRLDSVRVVGGLQDLAEVARRLRADVFLIAIAQPPQGVVRQATKAATEAGLRVLRVPPLEDMLRGLTSLEDLRTVSMEDLMGRRPSLTEPAAAEAYIAGRTVFVTGAGGSIGSELCRQVSRLNPHRLVMLDRDETALQAVQLAVTGSGLLDSPDIVLADIRDSADLSRIFARVEPDVVFHAAALKHLPMLEAFPTEGWKTNVIGTLNVLRAAESVGVSTFVNVSTDKAANPTSVLGSSKRLAERLTAAFAQRTGGRYLSVRFGNVLGSRGSLVPLFSELIRAGRPLTVTDPQATRYFMSIPEACLLVTHAGAIGAPGEVLILDMGEPVRILDVAHRMIEMSGRDLDIVFTGLRPGEKLHEELIGEGEVGRRRVHPKIAHADVPPILPEELDLQAFLGAADVLADSVPLSPTT